MFLTVPSAAPNNIRAKVVDNTTLYLTWDAPTKHLRNGIIRGYKVIVTIGFRNLQNACFLFIR